MQATSCHVDTPGRPTVQLLIKYCQIMPWNDENKFVLSIAKFFCSCFLSFSTICCANKTNNMSNMVNCTVTNVPILDYYTLQYYTTLFPSDYVYTSNNASMSVLSKEYGYMKSSFLYE